MISDLWSLNPGRYTVGPFDLRLPGPIKIDLGLDGEKISTVQFERGYIHRGLEKIFEFLPWSSGVIYADRLDGENAFFGEWVYCKAVEELLSLQIPKRAQMIRVILAELTRIQSHLLNFHFLSKSIHAGSYSQFVLRDREKILDLFELVSGSRMSLGLLKIGGVSLDVTEGFLERVIEVCDYLRIQINEYNDVFSFNTIFLDRSKNKGILDINEIVDRGVTGVNARACGSTLDYRVQEANSEYEGFDFEIPVAQNGDIYSRYILRLKEIHESINIIRQAVDGLPIGEYINTAYSQASSELMKVPTGEAYVRVESPRGMLGCAVMSEGKERPFRVQFRTPSLAHFFLIDSVLVGQSIEDMALILASLDLSISEIDR